MATPQRKCSELRQVEIITAALRILAEEGPRRFTVKQLALAVGLTEGAIFRHFPSMESIISAIVDHTERILFEDFPPKEPDPLKRLEAFFWHRIRAIGAHPDVSRLLLGDDLVRSANPETASRITEFKHRSRDFVRSCLREAKQKGQISLDPEAAMVLVLGAILALGHQRIEIHAQEDSRDLARNCWQGLLHALK